MRILICGIDGYIGYPLALHLLKLKHEVCGLDNKSRRALVHQVGSESLTPIACFSERDRFLRDDRNFIDSIACVNLHEPYFIDRIMREFKPDAIVHLAEQPSAPWSMINARNAIETQTENVAGTLALLWAMRKHCPDAHLVKLGTMGEYGTPDCDIPEGKIPEGCLASYGGYYPPNSDNFVEYSCPMSGLPFPRSPGSFYHLSKVHDTHNIIFACKTWGLRSTDIMQGVVYGTRVTGKEIPTELTRFDYDQYFGTIINRFCAQAIINHPLTIYDTGLQQRGFLPLKDSIQCLTIALENPPRSGEYRTFNQFEDTYQLINLAELVVEAAKSFGLNPEIHFIENPRTEASNHYYNPVHHELLDLGYKPTTNMMAEVVNMISDILPYANKVDPSVIMPTTTWK